jgi:MoxR-like ATPase
VTSPSLGIRWGWRHAVADELETGQVADLAERILDEVERAVLGKRDALELILLAMLADGHVLIEDNPGLAKTLIARSFAAVTGLRFARVQFTPDLMPSDITGASIFDQKASAFEFRPGPIFTNILLTDEINRAPPKTQSALLEAMQERQVTSDDRTRSLEAPFLVLATQNPIEYEGTYPLPEAQLDRFLVRVAVGYPSREDEWEMLARRAARGADDVELRAIVTRELFLGMQRTVELVHVSDSVGHYIVDLVAATRAHASAQVGASPRGTLALLKLARARAVLRGRDYITPDDVKQVALPALAHRILLQPELWVQHVQGVDVVRSCLQSVPVPTAELDPKLSP